MTSRNGSKVAAIQTQYQHHAAMKKLKTRALGLLLLIPCNARASIAYGSINTGIGSQLAGPHAVTQANGYSYQYDRNGNLTTATKSGASTKSVVYSPFNTPTSISQGSKWSNIVYGPNQERIKHSDSNGRVTKYV